MDLNVSSSMFIANFCNYAVVGRHEYDRVAGYLREAELIPVGARGNYAPGLNPKLAATLLIGMIAGNRPKDAVAAVNQFEQMTLANDRSPFGKKGEVSFKEAIAQVLSDVSLAGRIKEIRIVKHSLASAKIVFKSDKGKSVQANFGDYDMLPNFYSEAVITGTVMIELAKLFA